MSKLSYKFNLKMTLENLPVRNFSTMNSNFEYKMQISFNEFI